MHTSKIELTFGPFGFKGEGDEKWVAEQLDKAFKHIDKLKAAGVDLAPSGDAKGSAGHSDQQNGSVGTLAGYLKTKNASAMAQRKFLATAMWLQLKGKKEVTTADVTKSLREYQQGRLGNASECLNQNVAKGLIEKNGKSFYVTEDGREALK